MIRNNWIIVLEYQILRIYSAEEKTIIGQEMDASKDLNEFRICGFGNDLTVVGNGHGNSVEKSIVRVGIVVLGLK